MTYVCGLLRFRAIHGSALGKEAQQMPDLEPDWNQLH